jgi:predicted TIM-barrel fold metal-dependent hydrolase
LLEYAVSELGLKGVKIYPGAWKFYPNDPDVFPVYRKAVELGIPIMFCTSLWSPFYGGSKYARPVYIDDVVRTFPDGKFVIAHFGALGVGQESLAIACNYENVYLETAHAFTYPADLETAIAMVGPGRLLFGSDAPEWVPPAEQAHFLEETAEKVGLSKEDVDMIMGGNAAKLLGLS